MLAVVARRVPPGTDGNDVGNCMRDQFTVSVEGRELALVRGIRRPGKDVMEAQFVAFGQH